MYEGIKLFREGRNNSRRGENNSRRGINNSRRYQIIHGGAYIIHRGIR